METNEEKCPVCNEDHAPLPKGLAELFLTLLGGKKDEPKPQAAPSEMVKRADVVAELRAGVKDMERSIGAMTFAKELGKTFVDRGLVRDGAVDESDLDARLRELENLRRVVASLADCIESGKVVP